MYTAWYLNLITKAVSKGMQKQASSRCKGLMPLNKSPKRGVSLLVPFLVSNTHKINFLVQNSCAHVDMIIPSTDLYMKSWEGFCGLTIPVRG